MPIKQNGNGPHSTVNGYGAVDVVQVPDIDPSKLTITLTDSLKPLPALDGLVFGKAMTDHMLIMSFDPETGWSAPEIKPYGPLSLDPASNVLQYSTNLFEGMKAYMGPDGQPRLFRPDLNMKRMALSTARLALPPFDTDALLELIKKLVTIERRWIPNRRDYSLYIRPTLIGTTPSIGVMASQHAILYVILCPAGPYFPTGPAAISLLAVSENVRSWPGGTGGHKLGLNYSPTFQPQRVAAKLGYQQILWLLGNEKKITEAGAMNFFVVLKRDEDLDLDVITPPLDGTILPGLTRASCLALAAAHPSRTSLANLSNSVHLRTHERSITMADLAMWSTTGKLFEAFCVGTAVLVAGVGRIGLEGQDIVLPEYEGGRGPVAQALYERLVDIQMGKVEWEGWSVRCE